MAVDLSGLSALTTAAQSLSSLILVSPSQVVGYQPQQPFGPPSPLQPAFVFHYEGEQTATLESDITDHYVEDNIAVQDQIALKPEVITTHGFIGELNNVAPAAIAALRTAASKLSTVQSYVPEESETANLLYAEALFFYQTASNVARAGVSAWNTLNGNSGVSVIGDNGIEIVGNQTKQGSAFQQFYGYWATRTLFTIQTPWAVFENMAIQRLRAVQDAETRMITDFEISFKRIRKASTLLVGQQPKILQGRAKMQADTLVDLGTAAAVASISIVAALAAMRS